MYLYMFGLDGENIERFSDEMNAAGINGIVAGSFTESQMEVLTKHNLDAYLCFGSFSRAGFDDERLAVDYKGERKLWFGSSCPSDEEVADKRIREVLDKCRNIGIKGIFSDGARFASFASPEGKDAFYTCFCPRCIERAKNFNIDLEAARELYKKGDYIAGLQIMKKFRAAAMKEYFAKTYNAIKKYNASYKVAAFIFASSLAGYVGQGNVTDVDILAPMLYRRYPYSEGPACLNHEWAAASEMLGLWPDPAKTNAAGSGDLVQTGFEPEQLYIETSAVKNPAYSLMPIIQLEDDRLAESVREVEKAGADGCGFFMYKKEFMEKYYNL